MIHPRALQELRDAPRDSHTWMKKLSDKELDKALKSIGVELDRCKEPLDKHQKVCLILGIEYKTFAFWLDMGTGKTRVALELLRYWIKICGEFKVALVVAPSETVLFGWEKQIERWNIGLPYLTLPNSSSAEKWEQLEEFKYGIILGTFPGLTRMVSKLKEQERSSKKKLRINPTLVKRLGKRCGALVMDESTFAANKGSLNWRFCNQIRKYAQVCYQLAGRPFGSDPQNLWAQLYLIDKGETLGSTLGLFRAAFYEESFGYWGGREYTFKSKYKKLLKRILRHRSIVYSEEECGHVHKVINQLEEVTLPIEAKAYYEQFAKMMLKKHIGIKEKENAFLRMRQVSSGFVGFKNDESGEKVEMAFQHNPKLERLLELIEEMPAKRKFIVFHEFIYSGKMISEALKKRGIKHGCLRGGVKNSKEIRERFNSDPDYKGLVINHRVGAYGTDGLQDVANYCFVYESPVPPIDDEQMRKRLVRKGQVRTVHEYDLVCRGTADAQIIEAHRKGANLFKELIRGEVRL